MPVGAWLALAVLWVATACFAVGSARANVRRTEGRDTRRLDDIPGVTAINWALAVVCGALVVVLPIAGASLSVVVFWVLASVCAAWVCVIVLIRLTRRR